MPYPSQTLDIPISGGLAQNTQAELLDPGQALLTVAGLVHSKAGSLQKPPGFLALGTGTNLGSSLASATRIFAHKDEVNIIGTTGLAATSALPNSIFSYSAAAGQWGRQGTPPEAVVASRLPVCNGTVLDMCAVGAFVAVSWQTIAAVGGVSSYVVLLDATTFSVASPPQLIGTAFSGPGPGSLRLVACGAVLYAVYVTGGNLLSLTIDTTSASTINAGWSTGGGYGVTGVTAGTLDTLSSSPHFYVSFVLTATGFAAMNSVNAAGAIQSTYNSGIVSQATALGGSPADTIWFSYVSGQSIYVGGHQDFNLAITATRAITMTASGAEALRSVGVVATTTGAGVVVAGSDTGGVQTLYWRPFDKNAGVVRVGGSFGSATKLHYRLVPACKPFLVNARPYVCVSYQTSSAASAQQSAFCIDLTTPPATSNPGPSGSQARVVCTLIPRISVPPGDVVQTSAPHTPVVSGTTAFVLNTVTESTVVQGVELTALDFANAYAFSAPTYQDVTALGCGTPSFYDGAGVAELGFLVAPEITSATGAGSGTTFPNAQSWKYVAIYEHVDGRGQIHRSAPSVPFTYANATGAGIDHVTLTVTSLVLTQRTKSSGTSAVSSAGPVEIVIYRTNNAGGTYYRVGGTGVTPSDAGSTVISLLDTVADTTLQTKAALYTQPGTLDTNLPHVCPPSFTWMTSHVDRLWGTDGQNVWYSGQPVLGEGPWFSDVFQFPVLGGVGPLTGMASMDGRLILFKRNRVFVVDGLGPADNGAGNDISNPSELPVDVGCINPRSIVVTGEGVWFQSLRGLELLNRSLQLAGFAGDGVTDLVSPSNPILSAALNEQLSRVYFQSASGITIYRDLTFGTWSTYGIGGVRGAMIGSSGGVVPAYSYVSSGGQVFQESNTTWLVGGTATLSGVETAWLKMSRLQGYARMRKVLVLGKALASHGVTISVAFDNGAYTQSQTWSPAQLAAQAGAPYWQVQMDIFQQRCQSMRIKVTETSTTGTGQGMQLLGIGLEYAQFNRLARLPATQKG